MTSGSSSIEMNPSDLKKAWWLLLISGIFSVGIGCLLVFWPGATIVVVTSVVGLFMILTGVARFFVAVFDASAQDRWLMVIAAIIGIVLGAVVMKNPVDTIKVVVLIVAVFWLVAGLVDFFRGLTDSSRPDQKIRLLFGLMSALFGLVLLVWPGITVGVFAVLAGVYSVFFGVLEILAAVALKKS